MSDRRVELALSQARAITDYVDGLLAAWRPTPVGESWKHVERVKRRLTQRLVAELADVVQCPECGCSVVNGESTRGDDDVVYHRRCLRGER